MNGKQLLKWSILITSDLIVFSCAFGMYSHHDVLREKPYLLASLLAFVWVYYRFYVPLINYIVGLED